MGQWQEGDEKTRTFSYTLPLNNSLGIKSCNTTEYQVSFIPIKRFVIVDILAFEFLVVVFSKSQHKNDCYSRLFDYVSWFMIPNGMTSLHRSKMSNVLRI